MTQFDVCLNTANNADKYPYIVVLQSSLIQFDEQSVVAPLSRSHRYKKALQVCPQTVVNDEEWMLVIPQLASIPNHFIGKKVASMQEQRSDIISALDRLFTGIG